jgi:hypothetical protein
MGARGESHGSPKLWMHGCAMHGGERTIEDMSSDAKRDLALTRSMFCHANGSAAVAGGPRTLDKDTTPAKSGMSYEPYSCATTDSGGNGDGVGVGAEPFMCSFVSIASLMPTVMSSSRRAGGSSEPAAACASTK